MKPRRVLFIAEGQLGDLLLLTPALRAMKQSFPSSTISVLVVERWPATSAGSAARHDPNEILNLQTPTVLSTNPNVDEVFVLNRSALRTLGGVARVRAEGKVVRFLLSRGFDTVICTFPEDRFALWALFSGARIRVGQREQSLHWLLTRTPKVRKDMEGVLEYYCRLVESVGATVMSRYTEYEIPQSARQWADGLPTSLGFERGKKLVAVHPGATGEYRIWPPERFAALLDHLQTRKDLSVILCCGVLDEDVVAAIEREVRIPVRVVRTGSSIAHFAALLQRSSLCISNDSGPRHLAVAVGTPTLAFFRQFHEREWKAYSESDTCVTLSGSEPCPVCPPGVCLDRIQDGERYGSCCLRMVPVEQAIAKAERLLALSRNPQS